jgi:deoxyribonuclease V
MTALERAGRYGAVDVHYPQIGAVAAVVIAHDVTFVRLVDERVVHVPEVAPYQPGAFALRELPPILAVLAGVTDLQLLVVDGSPPTSPPRSRTRCAATSPSR